jgi:hypothetical protein
MQRILFVTTRNILNTSGEFRLINNRANALLKKWNIKTTYIVMCNEKKIKSQNELKCMDLDLIKFPFKNNIISIIGAYLNGKREISNLLGDDRYSCIILSGVGMLHYIPAIKKKASIPIIADIHGAKEELIEYKTGGIFIDFIKSLLFLFIMFGEQKYLKKTDGILSVSSALCKYLDRIYNTEKVKKYVIPCSVMYDETIIENREYYRRIYRSKYGLLEHDLVFVYSGGISPWQCIDETIDMFCNYRDMYNNSAKLLIYSHNHKNIEPLIKGKTNILLYNLESNEVAKALCAGDFAFMLREDNITNNVAYPNKFLEYIHSGLKVISTEFVHDVSNQIREYDLGITINSFFDLNALNNYIIETNKKGYNKENIKDFLTSNSFESTLSAFVSENFHE